MRAGREWAGKPRPFFSRSRVPLGSRGRGRPPLPPFSNRYRVRALKPKNKNYLCRAGPFWDAKELVLETYYNRKIAKHFYGTLDYQFVSNPAFNNARGPVSVFGMRLLFEY
jgi:hypothetical protein